MAIDFGNIGGNQPQQNTSGANTTKISSVTLDLNKTVERGVSLDLSKTNSSLQNILIGLGWDKKMGGQNVDLDLCCFMTNENGQLTSTQNVLFYGNMQSNGLALDKDNRTGEGDGDDEKITGDLANIPSDIAHIYIVASIYEAEKNQQTFGDVENSFVRLVDQNKNEELMNTILRTDFSTETSVIFGRLSRKNSSWEFHAIGNGYVADLNGIINIIANNHHTF